MPPDDLPGAAFSISKTDDATIVTQGTQQVPVFVERVCFPVVPSCYNRRVTPAKVTEVEYALGSRRAPLLSEKKDTPMENDFFLAEEDGYLYISPCPASSPA